MMLGGEGQTIRVKTARATTPASKAVPIQGGTLQGGFTSMPRWNGSTNLTVWASVKDGNGCRIKVRVEVDADDAVTITITVSTCVDDDEGFMDLDQQRAHLASRPGLMEKISWTCILMGFGLSSTKPICAATNALGVKGRGNTLTRTPCIHHVVIADEKSAVWTHAPPEETQQENMSRCDSHALSRWTCSLAKALLFAAGRKRRTRQLITIAADAQRLDGRACPTTRLRVASPKR